MKLNSAFARLDERFTDVAERVSSLLGHWPATAFFVFLFVAWLASGPFFHFSDSWQLIANTPTTWIELFQELFILTAANRIEAHNRALQENHYRLTQQAAEMIANQQRLIEAIETLLSDEQKEILAIEAKMGIVVESTT